MGEKENRMGSYIRKVRDETTRFSQELLTENERLRLLAATIESEKEHLEKQMEKQLQLLREEISYHQREQSKLQDQLKKIQAESRRYLDQYILVEEQNANLANLYVASYRLHGTLDRQEVLVALQEIVINLIGSEELAIFELDKGEGVLQLIASYGIDSRKIMSIPPGTGLIGKIAETGEMFIKSEAEMAELPDYEKELTACIPLKLDDSVMGAIAVFRLLPQKQGFETIDHALFDLLATHAANALYCTKLHLKYKDSEVN